MKTSIAEPVWKELRAVQDAYQEAEGRQVTYSEIIRRAIRALARESDVARRGLDALARKQAGQRGEGQ